MTKEEFIKKSKLVHGDKYDYTKVNYVNNKTKVCIICPEHGEFWQRPESHLSGKGCKKCSGLKSSQKQRKSIDKVIKEFREIHGDKYDYSKVNYINNITKVCIICPEHGEFWQTPSNHLKGKGCPSCYGNKKSSTEEFIKKAKQIHGDKYDYSKVEYKNADTKVYIICPEHGEFWQTPYKHIIRKQGCITCSGKKQLNTEEFIKKAKQIHGDNYDYSKVNYVNNRTKVCIICKKHGEFWQVPAHHLRGENCPSCNMSKLENKVREILSENNFIFEEQKKFKWLGAQRFDFYLPEYNLAIECQGIQHYTPTDFAGRGQEWAENLFKKNVENDKLKKKLSKENGIKILYIKYNEKNIENKIKKIRNGTN